MKKLAITKLFVIPAILGCAGTLAAQVQSMAGMSMQNAPAESMPQKKPQPDMQMPQDMLNLQNTSDTGAQKEAKSEQNSERQQHSLSRQKPGSQSDSQSATHPALTLQEPENPGHMTGESLPTPDLLKDVEQRAPMTLQDFLSLADHSNPTLAESRADALRSHAQARQAGMYPNPTVAYDGEQFRG